MFVNPHSCISLVYSDPLVVSGPSTPAHHFSTCHTVFNLMCHLVNALCTVLCSAISAVIFTMGGSSRSETFKAVILSALRQEVYF